MRSDALPPPIELARRRGRPSAPDPAVVELRNEIEAMRRVRDGEARRLEARISELERLLPELWSRGRQIEELTARLEEEQSGRLAAEKSAAIFSEEIAVLRQALAAEHERVARLSGMSDRVAPADPYRVWERRFRERLEAIDDDRTARLRGLISQQRIALEEKEARLAAMARRLAELEPAPAEGPDDLTEISGIGPVIAEILHDQGIAGFDDLAALTDAEAEELSKLMPVYPGRIADDRWIEQARELAEQRRRRREGLL